MNNWNRLWINTPEERKQVLCALVLAGYEVRIGKEMKGKRTAVFLEYRENTGTAEG